VRIPASSSRFQTVSKYLGSESFKAPYNQRLLLPGRERLRRRVVCLMKLVCGGFGTPRSRSAGR
jgi:hypothetical protein